METLRLKPDKEDINRAGEIIRAGGLVAFPTETVYGLGADALNEAAVKSIYQAKGRPSDNPMIVHIAEYESLSKIVSEVNEKAELLMKEFWPGPITFVLPKSSGVPDTTTGGLDTVAVRMPSNEIARNVIKASDRPIAAPSANKSGKPSPTNAEDVLEDMEGIIDAVIMGGSCDVGIESTVIDMTSDIPLILRPGFVTPAMILERTGIRAEYDPSLKAVPATEIDPEKGNAGGKDAEDSQPANCDSDFKPRSPGMKYKHYSPKARVILVEGDADIEKYRELYSRDGAKTDILDYAGNCENAAHSFFADLRQLDREGVEIILVRTLEKEGLGFSIMNRMLKSAGYEVIA